MSSKNDYKIKGRQHKARFVCVELLYHQLLQEQPTQSDSRFSRWLETDEQPYLRKLTFAEEWTKLDTGWIEQCSQFLLINEEGKSSPQLGNTSNDSKTLEVDVGGGVWYVAPGASMRGQPSDLQSVRVRCCLSGISARATLVLYPL